MIANHGKLPNADSLDYLSAKRLSPSRKSIYKAFDSLKLYQEEVSKRYTQEHAHKEFSTLQKMQEIKSLLPIEDTPSIIVDKLASEHMRIQAYAK